MKEALTFVTAIVILAIAQTLTKALAILLLILAIMGVVAFPRQTFALIASLGLLVLALKAPAACVAALAAIGVAVVLADRLKRPQTRIRANPQLLSHTPIDQTNNST